MNNDDEILRNHYSIINQYLEVVANVEVTASNPFPLGEGTIR
jgi:hypothetical protein